MSDYKNIPLIWFGNERIATGITTKNIILRRLLEDGYNIVAIIVNNQAREGTHKVRELEIEKIAADFKIPLHAPAKLSDIATELFDYKAQAAILVAYGKMVPQTIIDIFPLGIVNIHPSLLPKHRGSTPIESVILDGNTESGVSLMKLVKEMDAGPIFAQAPVTLSGSESKQELADSFSEVAASMLSELLPGILNEEIIAIPQEESKATYDDLIDKKTGVLDWAKSAEQLEREIRAYAEWPKSQTMLGEIEVIVTRANTQPSKQSIPGEIKADVAMGTLRVGTNNGYLCIERLKPLGKKEMGAADFLRGYGSRIS